MWLAMPLASEQGRTVWKEPLGTGGCGAPLSPGRQAAGGAQEWPAEGVPRQLTLWGPQRSAPAHLTGQRGRFLRPKSSLATTCDAGGPSKSCAHASPPGGGGSAASPNTRDGPVATRDALTLLTVLQAGVALIPQSCSGCGARTAGPLPWAVCAVGAWQLEVQSPDQPVGMVMRKVHSRPVSPVAESTGGESHGPGPGAHSAVTRVDWSLHLVSSKEGRATSDCQVPVKSLAPEPHMWSPVGWGRARTQRCVGPQGKNDCLMLWGDALAPGPAFLQGAGLEGVRRGGLLRAS